ncbi:hypothetical protein [Leuconostoc pseudomesenteroides]|uniref:Uncharacterized protein n=2 Tax=root TaxID=1 RepID=A0ABT6HBK3_LEUPS|nr:hypothetical protein [Leuconostoc pseudomesenteroides]MDG9733462.1 hypothetical protein [Leuconostoc pseudomesenteroides]QQB26690.1 hypothetical protein I6H60_06380 [Leuconostoc pseudomesenteroides]QQB26741.1 hypothetical protein I6H60_06645 [Leuconostoc pseudomesenteroides]
MKIVSLQSVGLGASYARGNGEKFNAPYEIYVGTTFLDAAGNSLDTTVTEIKNIPYFGVSGDSIPALGTYEVHTSDRHIRVLPADKYIAEWSDDTDRISPDDIGNDIHEFLHGGDK